MAFCAFVVRPLALSIFCQPSCQKNESPTQTAQLACGSCSGLLHHPSTAALSWIFRHSHSHAETPPKRGRKRLCQVMYSANNMQLPRDGPAIHPFQCLPLAVYRIVRIDCTHRSVVVLRSACRVPTSRRRKKMRISLLHVRLHTVSHSGSR